MTLLILILSRRKTAPSEVTTCQCGSGVSGTMKSSDKVRTFLPSLLLWVTNPVLALLPENLVVVCASRPAANAEPVNMNAIAAIKTRIEVFLLLLIYIPLGSDFAMPSGQVESFTIRSGILAGCLLPFCALLGVR